MGLEMSETKQEVYQPMTFDAIRIGLASPEKIREWSRGEVSDPARSGNVIAVSIKRSDIKALSATDVVLRLQNQASAESVWDILNLRLRYLISGISRVSPAVWD